MGAVNEKGKFGLGYSHKIQSKNLSKYFNLTKEIVCNRLFQIIVSLCLSAYISTLVVMDG